MKWFALLICPVLLLFNGCAPSAKRLNRLHVGMTAGEVERALGTPRSTMAQGGVETLIYQFTDKPFGDGMIFPGMYYVALTNGRVTGWSRDEMKDRMDRERAFRMNAAALAPPQRVQVYGTVQQNVNVQGNVTVRNRGY